MIDHQDDSHTLTRRTMILSGLGLGVFGVLGARLYQLQVLRAADYTALSEDNRFNYNILIPTRGRIFDRSGEYLAINQQQYHVEIISERIDDLNKTLDRIDEIVPLTPVNRERISKDVKKFAKFVPVIVKDHLSWDEFAALNFKAPELPGVIPRVGQGRSYPHQGAFSHVLGYVGRARPEDIAIDKDPLLRQPSFQIGRTGVEAAADMKLRGNSGRLKVEVNALGRIVREWPEEDQRAQPGSDVWLTLDAPLQKYAVELFAEDSGGVAVIDVMTGELRTLLSMPVFDANQFVSGLTQAEFDVLDKDPKRPQFNKVIGGNFPPASTFKMNVMLAALENRMVDPREKITCTGKIRLGDRNFHCWRRQGHGGVNMQQALQYSCDVYFYEMAQRMSMESVHDIAVKLGLGQTYELGISGQTKGVVPTPQWSREKVGTPWRGGDALNAFIGQGYVQVSPLQLSVMAARIANGNKAVSPHLIIGDNVPEFALLDIKTENMSFVQAAMRSVCHEPGGTAYRYMPLGVPGIEMAGKTGTGQVRGISASERASGVLKNRELDWQFRDHSIFVGYAPYDKPRFAVGTIVEHGGSGSKRAADITRKLLRRALQRDGLIEPDPEPSKNLEPEARL
ncbi:MAG: penicillin-binding protein 2 [Hellea sp.]|nr:penicillin-binding protein 2 [Hellea sp.]